MPAHDHRTHTHRAAIGDTLDFVNSAGPIGPDELPDDERVVAWLIRRGLVHPDNRRLAGSRDIASRAHHLRAALRALFAATTEHRSPEAAALAEINRALRAVAPIELTASADGYAVGHRHLGDPVDDALGRLAQVVLRAVTDGEIGRLRLCANARCRTAFRDSSRAGTRLWCDMTTCGNRAKANRHRARVRGSVGVAHAGEGVRGSDA
jgi:predicted RNA-binding Zn ribbon-like protein